MADQTTAKSPFSMLLEAEQSQTDASTVRNTKVSEEPPTTNEEIKLPANENTVFEAFDRESVEFVAFELRNARKKRVTTDIPEEWHDELFKHAFDLKVGRYELVGYILGRFLGRIGDDGRLTDQKAK